MKEVYVSDFLATAIITAKGQYGNGNLRTEKLKYLGYNPDEIQKVVNAILPYINDTKANVSSLKNNITLAYAWAIETCKNKNVRYSQARRNKGNYNGCTYYDCSSFIWYALSAGNFPIKEAYKYIMGFEYQGNAITTVYEGLWLLKMGFKRLSPSETWKSGDILLRKGHTEMVHEAKGAGKGYTMGAHGSSYPAEKQVSINTSPSTASSWVDLYRYGD